MLFLIITIIIIVISVITISFSGVTVLSSINASVIIFFFSFILLWNQDKSY